MDSVVTFLLGAVVGAIAAAAWLYYLGVRMRTTESADDLAVADVRIDAEIYGVGYLRKRPDGRLERVSPKLFDEGGR
jgi:hypothetical protein